MCNESGTGEPKLQFYSNDSMSPIPVNVNIKVKVKVKVNVNVNPNRPIPFNSHVIARPL